MSKVKFLISAIGAAVLVGGAASAGSATQSGGGSDPLASIQRGSWQLRSENGATRRICVRETSRIAQIEHGNAQCQQVVIDRSGNSTTVRYSCTGHGTGRSTITVETPRLIKIDTQGVANGSPFAEVYEGRFIGAC